jgi:hypothetical protein
MGLGCRKKGCGVWCGDDRKTTRWTLRARRATTAETVAGPAAQTRNSASTPASAGVNESGRWSSTTQRTELIVHSSKPLTLDLQLRRCQSSLVEVTNVRPNETCPCSLAPGCY